MFGLIIWATLVVDGRCAGQSRLDRSSLSQACLVQGRDEIAAAYDYWAHTHKKIEFKFKDCSKHARFISWFFGLLLHRLLRKQCHASSPAFSACRVQ